MNFLFKNEHENISISLVSKDHSFTNLDTDVEIVEGRQLIDFGEFLISIDGSNVERVLIEEKLINFMNSDIFYPLLIRNFFSNSIMSYEDFKKNISEDLIVDDYIYDIYTTFVVSLKTLYEKNDKKNIKNSLNVLSSIFPNKDFDMEKIYLKNEKNIKNLLETWYEIQELQSNIFESYIYFFFELFNNKSSNDFISGFNDNYLNYIHDDEILKIGIHKLNYENVIEKTCKICFDLKNHFDLSDQEKTEQEKKNLEEYQKYYDELCSDFNILMIFPEIFKKIRHISSKAAIKDVENFEIDALISKYKSYSEYGIINHYLFQILDTIIFDWLIDDELLKKFLNKSDCMEEDWPDEIYTKYTCKN